jgi:hypothetical protein
LPSNADAAGPGQQVEHNLAKVGVVGSNPIARSKICQYFNDFDRQLDADSPSLWVSEAPRKHGDSDFAAFRMSARKIKYQVALTFACESFGKVKDHGGASIL